MDGVSVVFFEGYGRSAIVFSGLGERFGGGGAGGEDDAVGEMDVAGDACLAGEDDVASGRAGAGDSGLRDDKVILPDNGAVGDLD